MLGWTPSCRRQCYRTSSGSVVEDNDMKTITAWLAAVVVIGLLWYGGFQISRWWNYKFGYESKVQAEVQKQLAPLEKRVTELEQEVSKLKK